MNFRNQTLYLLPPENNFRSKTKLSTISENKSNFFDEIKLPKASKFMIFNKKKNKIISETLLGDNLTSRNGPSTFISYLYIQKKKNINYFKPLLTMDIKIPLVDITLPQGIYFWDYIYYCEYSSQFIFQFSCNMMEEDEINSQFLYVISLFSNVIVLIIENDETNFSLILSQLKQFQYSDQIYIFHLVDSFNYKLTNIVDEQINIITLNENNYREKFNLKSSKVEIQEWQEIILMKTVKKTYKNMEIHIQSVFTLVNILTQNEFVQDKDFIFYSTIKKQILYWKKQITLNYKTRIQQLCSSSFKLSQKEIYSQIKNFRQDAQQIFFDQLYHFKEHEEYERQYFDLISYINNKETDCIEYFKDLQLFEINQILSKQIIIKRKQLIENNNHNVNDHCVKLFKEIQKIPDLFEIKFQFLKKHIKKIYLNLIDYQLKNRILEMQNEQIENLHIEICTLQQDLTDIQVDIDNPDNKTTKETIFKRHTNNNSNQSFLQDSKIIQLQNFLNQQT